jgi:Ser/Thr protein kinase RdoA (MazF antagonist)
MPEPIADFAQLTPDLVLHLVEEALGKRSSNLCRPLTSYINRVYDIQMDDGSWVVTKFYRPGRWSRAALQDEQDFLTELAAAEIPVIAALPGQDGQTLRERDGLRFAIYPKKGGRPCDEPTEDQWRELGRLLARVHQVGTARRPRDRVRIHPRHSTAGHVAEILTHDFPHAGTRRQFETLVEELLERITPLFADLDETRIHGDCHPANIIHRPGESFYLIDFDDMAVGPPVQDLWMLLPGTVAHAARELELMLEGYETFRDFDRSTLRLVEPLRAMRFLHYLAWCARQKADGGFARLAPDWGSNAFWRQEIADLERQLQEIADAAG